MSALLTELTEGPLSAQIAPHLSAGEIGIIYGLLHNPNISVTGDVSWSNFTMWLASGPMLAVSANATGAGCIVCAAGGGAAGSLAGRDASRE